MVEMTPYLWTIALSLLAVFPGHRQTPVDSPGDRPNILWITSEDNSPYLGCYGDSQALTPHLDRLASEGVRYRNAFANAPVCSTARSTLITGMHATTLGIHNHRSRVRIPESFPLYPEALRAVGYYCTNNSKTDYNLKDARDPWDESSPTAHYGNRGPGQPFFAVFNLTVSHEGQLTEEIDADRRARALLPRTPRVPPSEFRLPPYHPDTPVVRRDWSVYYDNVTLMDRQAGDLLRELEESGLAENTIVFYYSDHGGALPRGKRNLHDSGTRVPLIVRFPEKWSHLATHRPGEWAEAPVSFVDLPATLLSLAGAPIPGNYEGRAFLGPQKTEPREHVFLYRGRMDERYDMARAIRDARFRYIRNYSPHRPWGQHYSYPFRVMPMMASWHEACLAGRCDSVQGRYWRSKPPEELYDLAEDPHEIRNLADDPRHAERLAGMRRKLRAELASTRDTGFIPEGMFDRLEGDGTLYEYARSGAYPIQRIVEIADRASSGDPAALPALLKAMGDPHPVIRYWGATGCLILREDAAPARAALRTLIEDEWADVRIVAAEALGWLGEPEAGVEALAAVIAEGREYEVLAALNALEYMWRAGRVPLHRVRALVSDGDFPEPLWRIRDYLLNVR
jgi:N-sulfoglucosamine sulfohydrolase